MIVVDIQGLRLVSLTNGSNLARFKRHAVKKAQADLVRWALWAQSPSCPLSAPLDVTITRCAPGRFDSDNATASAKHVRDAVSNWIGIDDKHDDLVRYTVKQEKTKAGVYGVRIVVEPRRAVLCERCMGAIQ